MKFTSEDLMKAMGLQVGDRIKCAINEYIIIKINDEIFYEREGNVYSMVKLVNRDIEILPKPKRVGDLLCKDVECDKCPLRMVQGCENVLTKYTLYQCLEEIKDDNKNNDSFDQEIYDLLKARLDKEVE